MNRLFAAATACLLSSGAAMAQTPVNFPPSDFEGRQFVDNKGCAYIRVGVGPTVDWIPRMTRSRDQVCGLQPTFRTPTQTVEAPTAPTPTPTKVAPAPKPSVKTAAAPEPAPAPAPKVAKAAPTPAPKPTVVSKPKVVVAQAKPAATRKTRNAPMQTVASTVVARPQAATTTVLAPTTVVSGQPVSTASAPGSKYASVCPSRTGVSAQYTNSEGVRCGPQTAAPVKVLSVGGANQPLPTPPKGYVRIFADAGDHVLQDDPVGDPRGVVGHDQGGAGGGQVGQARDLDIAGQKAGHVAHDLLGGQVTHGGSDAQGAVVAEHPVQDGTGGVCAGTVSEQPRGAFGNQGIDAVFHVHSDTRNT